MLQDFVKKKFNDYSNLVEFSAGETSFRKIRLSNLPAFIINFFEYSLDSKDAPLDTKEFEILLNKAIIFNVNYIIKPKHTLLKFLFGDVETKPVEYITGRLGYFQFYGYYITHIADFISLNSLEIVSVNQVEHIINDVNKRLFEEINDPANDNSHRLNLVKLLYYFFVDLSDNNPINIKLPKKILSVFLADNGFYEIKAGVDSFFSEDIFIQEAIELMNPAKKRGRKPRSEGDLSEKQVKEIVSKAKSNLINKEESNKEVEIILDAKEKIPDVEKLPDVKKLRESETKMPVVETKTLVIEEEIYSDDLLFASQFHTIIPEQPPLDTEIKDKLLNELFCEESYKKRIIKKLFRKDESLFKKTAVQLIELNSWSEAAIELDKIFSMYKIDYYSEEAVKFVDIFQSHFSKTTVYSSQKQQGT